MSRCKYTTCTIKNGWTTCCLKCDNFKECEIEGCTCLFVQDNSVKECKECEYYEE